MLKQKAIVVLPTYNERENLPRIAPLILAQSTEEVEVHLLIVDDNSPDGTGKIADDLARENPLIKVLHRPGKLGLGTAYCEGFGRALKEGADYLLEMDADFSHDPAYIRPMLAAARQGTQVVIGSRYKEGISVVNWPLKRLLLSYFANMYARVVTGLPLADCTGGFKCFKREVLTALDLNKIKSKGYSFQLELNYRCFQKGFSFTEVPIIFYNRKAGVSKMSGKIIWEAFWMAWRLRLGG